MKLPRSSSPSLCLTLATVFVVGTTRAAAEGTSVGVPKAQPVFNVDLPEGWRAKDALTGISPELWSKDNGISVSFEKAGTLAGDEPGKARVDNEAKMAAMGEKDIKCTQPAAVAGEEVAGHKTYQTAYTYGAGEDASMIQVDAFSVDGKDYYLARFRGPKAKMEAGAEVIAGVLESIAAAK